MNSSRMGSKALGDELERRVSVYYEALGYQLTKNVVIQGHQIDILATRHIPGASTLTIAIEVKHRSGGLGVNDITVFLSAVDHLRRTGHINGAVIVTNGKISKEAQSAAYGSGGIRLISVDQLEQELLNNSDTLIRIIHDQKKLPIFEKYYPLRAQAPSGQVNDAAEYLAQWSQDNNSTILLVGDFGSGKSTVMNRVLYETAQRRLARSEERFPISLKLNILRRFTSLWDFVEASLRDNQYINPPRQIFEEELLCGRLIVLLDGFDEIQTGATARDKAEYINMLSPLLVSKSPCIMSTRPTFFDSFSQMMFLLKDLQPSVSPYERLPEVGIDRLKLAQALGEESPGKIRNSDVENVISLLHLDDRQVTAEIANYAEEIRTNLGLSVEAFKDVLYRTYDLADLMRRPLLLDMIINTASSGAIDYVSAQQVGPSTLYEVYTQRAARRRLHQQHP